MQSNTETMELITDECIKLKDTLIRKNVNYGSAFENRPYLIPAITPFGGLMVRLSDKFKRLATLLGGEPDTVGETIEDTLDDIAGYAILAKVLRRKAATQNFDEDTQN